MFGFGVWGPWFRVYGFSRGCVLGDAEWLLRDCRGETLVELWVTDARVLFLNGRRRDGGSGNSTSARDSAGSGQQAESQVKLPYRAHSSAASEDVLRYSESGASRVVVADRSRRSCGGR